MAEEIPVKGRFRLTKDERLRDPKEFKKVMRTGRRLNSGSFLVFTRRNDAGMHRFGVVTRKVTGPATFRNRMRRLAREFFRLHKHEIKGSYDIVFLVREGCSVLRLRDVESELKKVFSL